MDSSIECSMFLSFLREFSIRMFVPLSILSESLRKNSSFKGAVGTVVAIALLLLRVVATLWASLQLEVLPLILPPC